MDWHDLEIWGLLYVASEWVIRISMLGIVPWRRTAQAASAWLLLIFFLPWLGFLLYLAIGWPKMPQWRREKLECLIEAMRPAFQRLRGSSNVIHPEVPAEFVHSVRLATNLGRLPIVGGNAAEILADYQPSIDRLVADIDSATHYVHLLYYIFGDDTTSARVIDALTRAVARGVQCRVLVDAVGNKQANTTLLPKLRGLGVNAREVLPVGFFHRKATRYDLRNHRKIAVIDGRVGYTGSLNLVDPKFKKNLEYEEVSIRVTGPVVLHLQILFAADWCLETDESLVGPMFLPEPHVTGNMVAQVLASGPGFELENNQRLIVSLIHGARSRIVITTPYFIPDEALLQALQTAVLRGVEVHLIVSRQRDQIFVGLAQESYYGQLLEAGVHIHRYKPRFLHAKHLTFDDDVAIIGSSNIDIRSFLLNAEVSLIAYDSEIVARLRQEQERYFHNSDLVTGPRWNARPRRKRFIQHLARLVSPLL